MRTFGRILGGLGLGLICIGGVGAVSLLPPPVLGNAVSYVEEKRLALRAYLPDLPALGALIAGASQQDCTGQPQGEARAERATPAADCEAQTAPATLLRRSDSAATRFRAPAATAADTPAD